MILWFIKKHTSNHIILSASTHYRWSSLCREPPLPRRDHPHTCIFLFLRSPIEYIIAVLCIFSLGWHPILTTTTCIVYHGGCSIRVVLLRSHVKLTRDLSQWIELLRGRIDLYSPGLYCGWRSRCHSECRIVSCKISSLISVLWGSGCCRRGVGSGGVKLLDIWSQPFYTFFSVIETT